MSMSIKKKTHPKFYVPNFGAPNRKRVMERWRKQRGIDNKKRVKKKEMGASPSIGYKNSEEIRHARPDGTFEALVHDQKELMALIESKEKRSVRFSHTLSTRKRRFLQDLADKSNVRIVNRVAQ